LENPETIQVETIITATLNAIATTAIRIINRENDLLSPSAKRFAVNNSKFILSYAHQKYFFPFVLPTHSSSLAYYLLEVSI